MHARVFLALNVSKIRLRSGPALDSEKEAYGARPNPLERGSLSPSQ